MNFPSWVHRNYWNISEYASRLHIHPQSPEQTGCYKGVMIEDIVIGVNKRIYCNSE